MYIYSLAPRTAVEEKPITVEESCNIMIEKVADFLNGELADKKKKLTSICMQNVQSTSRTNQIKTEIFWNLT